MNQGVQAAAGISGILGQGMGMVQEAKNINTTAPTRVLDAFGKPIFNLGDFQSQVSAIKPQDATFGEKISAGVQGASAAASLGPVGALLGFGFGTLSAGLFGRRRRNLQRDKKTLAQSSLFNAQRMFNQGMESYNAKQSAQSLYNEQGSINQGRINNVYQALS